MDNRKKTSIILLIVVLLSAGSAQAQQSINTSGGIATGSEGSASYSIGQIVYLTFASQEGSVAEGVQQPFEIWAVTTVEEEVGISLTVYPNPTKNFLTLSFIEYELTGIDYLIFDLNGRVLLRSKINDPQTNIDMGGLVPAVYFLRVMKHNKELKTFKIIKN